VLDLQLRHGLASSEVASVLGVSRNHAHALMSRARVPLETALRVLVVARSGRQECAELNAMLDGWDGRLTVLVRKRVNRHVERCAICSRRRDQEMTPAMLLGMAPVLALPLAASLPAALRDQVMRAAFGSSPAAVAHRAALGRTAYSFGHQGFPQPLHPLHAPWWQAVPAHFGAAAGTATAAAAAVVAGVTLTVIPHHHTAGHHPGGGAAAVASGITPATVTPVKPMSRGPGTPRASVVATVGASVTPSPLIPSPSEVSASVSASASPTEAESPTASDTAVAGTLQVSPGTLDITSPGTGTITLTASGGPVDWSVSVPAGKTKKDDIEVTPTSGTLADGDTITVSVTVNSATRPKVRLTFSPGGKIVKIAVD